MPFLLARPFGDAQLEALFSHQQLHRAAGDLLRVLSLLVPAQLLLALFRVPRPDASLLLLTGSAAVALVLCLLLSLAPARWHHLCVPPCALWLCTNVLFLLPAGGTHALLPSIIAIFCLYAFFPFRPCSLVVASAALSLAQLGAFALAGEGPAGVEKLLAALLAHLWTHLVGLYSLANWRKISRAVFLNARNALESEAELETESARMAQLLGSALPPHIISSVQSQLDGAEVPRVFVEHFAHSSVLFARLYGLPSVLAQLQVSDSARLLNELDVRVAKLAKLHGLLPVQSDAILALSGVPKPREDHALAACRFAFDLLALFRSFCEATSTDVQLKIGVGSGSLSGGIVGARRWHWDVIGMAMDAAMHLEGNCPAGAVLVSEDTWRQLGGRLHAERVDQGAWRLSIPGGQPAGPCLQSLLFPSAPRRFSLMTVPQSVGRLLLTQSLRPSALPAKGASICTPFSNARKGKTASGSENRRVGPCQHSLATSLLHLDNSPLLLPVSLRFADLRLEHLFHAQVDRWFIPGLALSVLFLALFGLFQALVMPRLLTTLATLALALGLMFLLLLALYVSYCESFCQFVTRTAIGHSTAVLLVLALLSTCGIANTFSCPSSPSTGSSVCQPVHFPALSFALWMLHSSVFVRFPSVLLLLVLLSSVCLFSVHLLLTHSALYPHFLLQADLLVCLLALALLLFLHSRRNEQLIRMDFLAILRLMEDGQKLERVEFLNDQILLNALPAHIAFNHVVRTEPFAHLCPSVGVLCARFGRPGDWVGEFGFDRLNRLVCELDQRLGQLSEHRLFKVRSAHSSYTVACGILPERARNVHDAPCTIGEQLAVLAEFAQEMEKMAEAEGLDIAVGVECGAALSVVVGWDRPRYELFGQPSTRAKKLADAASALGGDCVLLSEDVYSALRPRSQFQFDERSALSVAPGLVAYSLLRRQSPANSPPPPALPATPPKEQQAVADPEGKEEPPPPPPPHRPKSDDRNNYFGENHKTNCNWAENWNEEKIGQNGAIGSELLTELSPCSSSGAYLLPSGDLKVRVRENPLAEANMFSSMHSSLSSELFSVDMSVETDSELEWITPEMIANREYRPFEDPLPVAAKKSSSQNKTNGNCHQPSLIAAAYKGDRARQYSDFSEAEQLMNGGNFRRKETSLAKRRFHRPMPIRNGPKLPKSWRSSENTSAFGSELSLTRGDNNALDRLNSAARRVDRMLKELAGMESVGGTAMVECVPFPLLSSNNNIIGSPNCAKRRESGSAAPHHCLSEYDNAEDKDSEFGAEVEGAGGGICSDSEVAFGGSCSRLEQMRKLLTRGKRTRQMRQKTSENGLNHNNGNEADISCCSSVASSQIVLDRRQKAGLPPLTALRWRQSIHSIGYDNEYELTSAPVSSCSSYATGMSIDAINIDDPIPTTKPGPSVGENFGSEFAPIDDQPGEEDGEERKTKEAAPMLPEGTALRRQVLQLSRQIRNNFGDFQLATFSDVDSECEQGN